MLLRVPLEKLQSINVFIPVYLKLIWKGMSLKIIFYVEMCQIIYLHPFVNFFYEHGLWSELTNKGIVSDVDGGTFIPIYI